MNPYVKRELKRPLSWARKRTQPRATILMYHCVGVPEVDPWSLFVQPGNFAGHLAAMKEIGTPMALGDLVAAHRDGRVPDRAIAVTFDDGYANNFELAAPLLEEHEVPATVFAVAEPIIEQREFWWDELAMLLLRPGLLPAELCLDGDEAPIRTGAAAQYSQEQFLADHRYREGVGVPSDRVGFYMSVWQRLMPMENERRKAVLGQIAEWSGAQPTQRAGYRPVTEAELVAMDATIIDVEAHTMSHPLLPGRPFADQVREVEECKGYLEDVLDRPIELFSYPFGGRNPSTMEAVRQSGFGSACTTFPETVSAANHPYELPRFDVKDWEADDFARRLQRWFRYV